MVRKTFCWIVLLSMTATTVFAGMEIRRSNGITLTGADGIRYYGTSGITLTGADGFLAFDSNGITLTGADGITLTGADDTLVGADGASYTGPNGITLTGADGITLTGADGVTLTDPNGITLTGADGSQYTANSIIMRGPNGITLTGADGITLTGADGITLTGADGLSRVGANGITLTGADGITLTGADGITLTGANGITLTGADQVTGFSTTGMVFDRVSPAGMTVSRTNGITLTGADGITLTGADGIFMRNIGGGLLPPDPDELNGLQSVDPEFATVLYRASDDSNLNAVVAFHDQITEADLNQLRQIGILGGTRFRALPMVYVSGTKLQILAVSHLSRVRSIYGNRTLTFNSDPFFRTTGITRIAPDNDLRSRNGGFPISGRNVTVAVLDTGINGLHPDLSGKVVQNVRLADVQSLPTTFLDPVNVENLQNSDPVAGHGTFVAGIIAGSGSSSGGRYGGVAPGARLLGLSAGDIDLTHVLSGFDYLLERGPSYGVKVVNCSFSANSVYDSNDPVNIATKMLTDRGVNIVFSAGNTGPGNSSMNPYAVAPWVVGVGATNENGVLADFSSRGTFGSDSQPTLVAPGDNVASIRSTVTTTSVGGVAGADQSRLAVGELPFYTTARGTSFSAPQVAGAIAMMLEANPTLTPADVKRILARTATPLPKNFSHEVGSGMLNSYAAVLEAAFPDRPMGIFRSAMTANAVRFATSTSQTFTETVTPGTPVSVNIPIPADTLLATVGISWGGLNVNDLGLQLYNPNNTLAGESNYLNLPGLTGRHEQVILRNPTSQTFRAATQHTLGIGTAQSFFSAVEITQAEYPNLADLNALAPEARAAAEQSLLSNVMLTNGGSFGPNMPVRRADLAATFLRAGLVPQYMASTWMFTDVRDVTTRNAVESVQTNPNGPLFYDATAGGNFNPHNSASKLVTAVAMVKAAGLDSAAATAVLPVSVTDRLTIPSQWRGYAAVALQYGFISLDGNQFNQNRAITRLELAKAVNALMQ